MFVAGFARHKHTPYPLLLRFFKSRSHWLRADRFLGCVSAERCFSSVGVQSVFLSFEQPLAVVEHVVHNLPGSRRLSLSQGFYQLLLVSPHLRDGWAAVETFEKHTCDTGIHTLE